MWYIYDVCGEAACHQYPFCLTTRVSADVSPGVLHDSPTRNTARQ